MRRLLIDIISQVITSESRSDEMRACIKKNFVATKKEEKDNL
jgi:hypothetical protein